MAVPTLTANSPQVGFISWSAFTIQYLGQSYPIASGYSGNKFVWWLYNGGSGGPLQAGDTLPTLSDDDLLLFLNKSGVPVNVQTASVVDGSIIASGSILGDAIAANTISGDNILAGSILSGEIGAGEIRALNIAAGAITANALESNLVLTNQIQVGSGISINPTDGILVTEPNGSVTQIAADGSGSRFAGSFTADDLTVMDSLDIRGSSNYVNGDFIIGGAMVNDPNQQIAVSFSWDSTQVFPDAGDNRTGLDDLSSTKWLTADYTSDATTGYLQAYNKDGTGGSNVVTLPTNDVPWGGVAVIGTTAYVLVRAAGTHGNAYWVYLYDTTSWAKTGEWQANPLPSSSYLPALGRSSDGNLVIVQVDSSKNLWRYVLTPATGAQVSATNLGAWSGTNFDLTGCYYNAATPMTYVANASGIRAYKSNARSTGDDVTPAASVYGLCNDSGGVLRSSDRELVYAYTSLTGQYDFAYTWYDSTTTGGNSPGTAETLASPIKTVRPRRAKVTLQLPSKPPYDGTPDGADTARLYGATHGGTLGLLTTLADGVYSNTYSTISPGAAPPATSTFVGHGSAAPGSIRSMSKDSVNGNVPAIQLDGNGYAFIDKLTYNSLVNNQGTPYVFSQSASQQNLTAGTDIPRTGWTDVESVGFSKPGSGIFQVSNSAWGAGVYNFSGQIAFTGSSVANARGFVNVVVNGTTIWTASGVVGNRYTTFPWSFNYRCYGGDQVQIVVGCSGDNLSTIGNAAYNVFSMYKLGT